MYLLDTNVVFEFRRVKPHGAVVAWLNTVAEADLYLSAVTIGELQAGVETIFLQDPAKAMEIEAWLERISGAYNVLPMDVRAFRRWAKLMHGKQDLVAMDAMIAATAMTHNLTVVTRHIRDFEQFAVETLNPFESASGSRH